VSERDDIDSIHQVDKDDVVRKGVNRHLADMIVFHVGHTSANLRKSFNQFQGHPHLSGESRRHSRIAVSVPIHGFAEFNFRGTAPPLADRGLGTNSWFCGIQFPRDRRSGAFSTAEDFALNSVQNGSPLSALELTRACGCNAFLNLCRPGRFDVVFRVVQAIEKVRGEFRAFIH
jgi:hypothetical protein